jgi:TrmH family RNA methyltransferase
MKKNRKDRFDVNNRPRRVSERNDLYQVLSSLKQNRKKRNELGELFVEGIEAIKQALASSRVRPKKLLFAEYEGLSDWARDLVGRGVFEESVSLERELYEELADRAEPSEIMATFGYDRFALADIALPPKPFIVVFDRPSDMGNLGSLIRSANAFGVDLFITHGHCVDLFEPKVIRSSLGAIFHTPVAHVESFDELSLFLGELKKKQGLVVAGTDSQGAEALGSSPLAPPVALILGNEAKGMSVRLKEMTDEVFKIPLDGEVNSLNVACAGSIFFYAIASART